MKGVHSEARGPHRPRGRGSTTSLSTTHHPYAKRDEGIVSSSSSSSSDHPPLPTTFSLAAASSSSSSGRGQVHHHHHHHHHHQQQQQQQHPELLSLTNGHPYGSHPADSAVLHPHQHHHLASTQPSAPAPAPAGRGSYSSNSMSPMYSPMHLVVDHTAAAGNGTSNGTRHGGPGTTAYGAPMYPSGHPQMSPSHEYLLPSYGTTHPASVPPPPPPPPASVASSHHVLPSMTRASDMVISTRKSNGATVETTHMMHPSLTSSSASATPPSSLVILDSMQSQHHLSHQHHHQHPQLYHGHEHPHIMPTFNGDARTAMVSRPNHMLGHAGAPPAMGTSLYGVPPDVMHPSLAPTLTRAAGAAAAAQPQPSPQHQQMTYFGMVKTTADAIKLLASTDLPSPRQQKGSGAKSPTSPSASASTSASDRDLPPRRIKRRLLDSERAGMIRSGSVFAWDEKEAGMRRWTDGRCWSASRVSGCFLTYRELHVRKHRSSHAGIGPQQNQYKMDGLIKQSFSMTTTSGRKMHIISYYTKRDLRENLLRRVSEDGRFDSEEDAAGWNLVVDEAEFPDPALLNAHAAGGGAAEDEDGSSQQQDGGEEQSGGDSASPNSGLEVASTVPEQLKTDDKPKHIVNATASSPRSAVSAKKEHGEDKSAPAIENAKSECPPIDASAHSSSAMQLDPADDDATRYSATPLSEARGLLPIQPIPMRAAHFDRAYTRPSHQSHAAFAPSGGRSANGASISGPANALPSINGNVASGVPTSYGSISKPLRGITITLPSLTAGSTPGSTTGINTSPTASLPPLAVTSPGQSGSDLTSGNKPKVQLPALASCVVVAPNLPGAPRRRSAEEVLDGPAAAAVTPAHHTASKTDSVQRSPPAAAASHGNGAQAFSDRPRLHRLRSSSFSDLRGSSPRAKQTGAADSQAMDIDVSTSEQESAVGALLSLSTSASTVTPAPSMPKPAVVTSNTASNWSDPHGTFQGSIALLRSNSASEEGSSRSSSAPSTTPPLSTGTNSSRDQRGPLHSSSSLTSTGSASSASSASMGFFLSKPTPSAAAAAAAAAASSVAPPPSSAPMADSKVSMPSMSVQDSALLSKFDVRL